MDSADLRNLLARVMAGDPSAADELEALAGRLHDIATRLRAGQAGEPGTRDPGGMTDRVQMQVVGPDGHGNIVTKQKVDTQ